MQPRVRLLTAMMVGALLLAGCASGARSMETAPPPEPSWISDGLRAELRSDPRFGVQINSVRLRERADETLVAVVSGTVDASVEATRLTCYELTSMGGRGALQRLPVGSDGRFVASFDFPLDERNGEWALYDVALVSGHPVFLDFENERWALEDGGVWAAMLP